VEYTTPEDAAKAVTVLNNRPFDKAHTTKAFSYDNFKQYIEDDSHWAPPAPVQVHATPDMHSWLLDEACRDQYATAYFNSASEREQEVLWSDGKHRPQLEFSGDRESMLPKESKAWKSAQSFRWSPKGTYIVTLAYQGVRLWSGPSFTYGQGFSHVGVNEVAFSADERYLLTWNGEYDNPNPADAIIIWDVWTG
jgi:hypothetical protein